MLLVRNLGCSRDQNVRIKGIGASEATNTATYYQGKHSGVCIAEKHLKYENRISTSVLSFPFEN